MFMRTRATIRIIILAMIIAILFASSSTAFAITNIAANTSSSNHKYSADWEWWSQGASKNSKIRAYGCHVVAQAKLLVECGAASSNVNVFNPDIYWDWALANGYFESDIDECHPFGQAAIAWAANNGITLTRHSESLTGSTAQKAARVMELINAGYYVYLDCTAHQSYVGRNASLSSGKAILLNSWKDWSQNNGTRLAYENYTAFNFTTVYYFSANGSGVQTSVLDVNGELNGGIYSGGIEGMGTFDVYINGELVSNDCSDFWQEIPRGSSYTITDIKSSNAGSYTYVGEQSYSGTIGQDPTNICLHFVTPHVFDVNGIWNGTETGDTAGGCTFDVYINDVLVADNWSDYYGHYNWGSTYMITDIQSLNPEGYDYVGEQSYSGTIYDDTKIILPFATAQRTLDINGYLNDEHRWDVNGVGTFDLYINDELVENDISDYTTNWPYGTRYRVTDIRPTNDSWFAYVGEESYEGVIGQWNEYVELPFVSFFELNVNGRWEDTETDDTVNGCTFDVYINDELVADGWSDYYAWIKYGSNFRITNIESLNPDGYDYVGEESYSGTINDTTKIILPFAIAQREVDLNGFLDGEDKGWLDGIATADVYINGELLLDDTCDYVSTLPYGTEYLVNDIKLLSDAYIYVGPSSFSGVVGMERTDIRLSFISAERLVLPDNTEIIKHEAFMNVSAEVIVLPKQVTTIEERAFADCTELKRIIIPGGVTSIAENVFENCSDFTIICKPGSYAETFAKEHNLSYAELRTN